ncbi:MAG: NAD-dependent epimerase/dehydratase family protein [Candidatus Omnitrophota bacterium]|nr:NAD-dependent epimerase/dehydratase family protein [Candidatus Omnitrophota bacterium]
MKKALCLVTGGAGFIGSHIVEALLKRKYRVRVLDNLSTGFRSNLSPFKGSLELQKGDLRSQRDVNRAVKGVKYVYHVGANRAVLRSVDAPLETNEVNVTGTLRLLIASRNAGVKRLVFSSSSSIYGNTDQFPVLETQTPMPESPYAASKIMGEYYCRQFFELFGLETVSLRYFNVFGPRQNPESKYSAVIPIFIDCILKKKRPEVHWDGKQSRDFSYVDNVVHGNLRAMATPGVAGQVFNIACHEEFSVNDILHGLEEIMKVPRVKPIYAPKRAGDVRRTYAAIQKSKKYLKFKVQTRFRKGLERTVAWFLSERILEKGRRRG